MLSISQRWARTPAPSDSAATARRGFTLLELLVVIAVIAVLLGIALPALRAARRAATDNQCRSRLASIGGMYELYAAEHRGRWATLQYPPRLDGTPDVLRTEWWGGSFWFVLPVNEMTFWGFPLREYASENYESDILRTAEALSCPVHFNRWRNELPPEEQSGDAVINDPMWSPQNSYFHSFALFTSASGWAPGAPSPPDVNLLHTAVQASAVAHPSRKASLVEKESYHHAWERRIDDDSAGPEQFNILAADGHVERRAARDAADPSGFVAFYTGFEIPPQESDQHAETGIRYVSTRSGALGRDW